MKSSTRILNILPLQPAEFNNYNIKSPTSFGQLSTFLSIDFFMCDELHMFSNVSKLCFDLMSSRYNGRYKFAGKELKYPFSLSNDQFQAVKRSMDDSRCTIPTDFNGSFKGMSSDNVRSLYRSVDWIAWLIYVVPTIIAPLFSDKSTRLAFISLCRGIKISLQWSITSVEVREIERYSKNCFQVHIEFS